MKMTINITKGTTNYEFYGVPDKIGKAIITLLDECGNDNSSIVSAQSEVEDTISTLHKYQKIEQIMKSTKMNAFNIGLLIPKDMACVLHEIKEVIEDDEL